MCAGPPNGADCRTATATARRPAPPPARARSPPSGPAGTPPRQYRDRRARSGGAAFPRYRQSGHRRASLDRTRPVAHRREVTGARVTTGRLRDGLPGELRDALDAYARHLAVERGVASRDRRGISRRRRVAAGSPGPPAGRRGGRDSLASPSTSGCCVAGWRAAGAPGPRGRRWPGARPPPGASRRGPRRPAGCRWTSARAWRPPSRRSTLPSVLRTDQATALLAETSPDPALTGAGRSSGPGDGAAGPGHPGGAVRNGNPGGGAHRAATSPTSTGIGACCACSARDPRNAPCRSGCRPIARWTPG